MNFAWKQENLFGELNDLGVHMKLFRGRKIANLLGYDFYKVEGAIYPSGLYVASLL